MEVVLVFWGTAIISAYVGGGLEADADLPKEFFATVELLPIMLATGA